MWLIKQRFVYVVYVVYIVYVVYVVYIVYVVYVVYVVYAVCGVRVLLNLLFRGGILPAQTGTSFGLA